MEAVHPVAPERPFEVFEPTAGEPFDTRRLCHLLRRTSFGATPKRLAMYGGKPPGDVVNALLNYEASNDPFEAMVEGLEGFVDLTQTSSVASYWFYRMQNSPQPMQERLALFWHGRWATGASKVGSGRLMHEQIQTFRRMGIGNFRQMAVAMGRDPAMLIWLDGQYNRKGRPNENYGREVMELFILGIGNYTEIDVRELARAFTGWRVSDEQAMFDLNYFDAGRKEILGHSGDFDSESAMDVLLSQPAAGTHLSRNLLIEFVHPQPTDEHVKHYAARLVALNWDVKAVLAEMLASRMFFSDWAYRARIKSPVELAIGAALAMGGKVSSDFLRDSCVRLGQNLLNPPNVKGWPGGETWINSNTVLLRFNFAMQMATQRQREFVRKDDLYELLNEHNVNSADEVVDHFSLLLVDGQLRDDARQQLLTYMNTDAKGNRKEFKMSPEMVNSKVRGVLHMMMTMPEFQLA